MTPAMLLQIVMGWPAILCSLALLIAGVAVRKRKLSLAGALVSSGFCLYLTGASFLIGPLVYASNWGSYYFLRAKNYRMSALLVAPFASIVGWFAVAVLLQ